MNIRYDDIDLLCDLKQGSGLKLLKIMMDNGYEFAKDVAKYIQTRNEIWLEDFLREQGIKDFWKHIPEKR